MLIDGDSFASGTAVIPDTLKKFTDLIDKKLTSQFGVIARGFLFAEGTLISLTHTNKHVGVDGKKILPGTSDICDDSDCVFVIDTISSDELLYAQVSLVLVEEFQGLTPVRACCLPFIAIYQGCGSQAAPALTLFV